jgi:hypothetical protein
VALKVLRLPIQFGISTHHLERDLFLQSGQVSVIFSISNTLPSGQPFTPALVYGQVMEEIFMLLLVLKFNRVKPGVCY